MFFNAYNIDQIKGDEEMRKVLGSMVIGILVFALNISSSAGGSGTTAANFLKLG
ncbi:hypothetical protein ES708_19461 [subsurface metagenome]